MGAKNGEKTRESTAHANLANSPNIRLWKSKEVGKSKCKINALNTFCKVGTFKHLNIT